MTPRRTKPNVIVSVRNVPTVDGRGLLRRQACREGDRRDDRHEAADQHDQARGNVQRNTGGGGRRGVVLGLVESPRVRQALKAGAVVGRGRTELIQDLGKPVRPGLLSALTPQSVAAKRPVGAKIINGWISKAKAASFISRALDLLAHVFGRSADHEARKEHADDEVNQQVDEPHADAAPDAVEPHPGQWDQPDDRVETVVHAVHGAVGGVRCQRRPGSARRRPETEFLSFQVPQGLIHGKAGHRRNRHVAPAVGRRCVGDRVGSRVMGGQARVRFERVVPNRERDGANREYEHHGENHRRIAVTLEHLAEHHQGGHGEEKDPHARQEIAEGIRVFKGMRGIGAEEPASIGAKLLRRNDRRDRAAGDLLDQCRLTIAVGAHCPRLQRGRVRMSVQRHRHAAGHEQHTDNEAERHEDVGRPTPQIDIEIAHVLVAAQPANNRHQGGHPDHRRKDLLPEDEEQLAEVRQVDLAGVVLEIGVRQKRADRVEDRRRGEHLLAVWVQRQIGLQSQDREPDQERHDVEGHERQRILLPVLRAGVQPRFDPSKPPRRVQTAIEHPGHVQADRDRQRKRRAVDKNWKNPDLPHGRHPFLLEPLGPQQGGGEVNQQQHGGRRGENL